MTTTIRPIKTDADYEAVVARIDALMSARSGTPEAEELDVLGTLVDAYEARRFPIAAPDPIDAIRFRMEQAGLQQRDLVPMIGSRARVSEVLSGKRPLTLPMIRALSTHLGIPAESLLGVSASPAPEPTGPRQVAAERFPLVEMARRGWIAKTRDYRRKAADLVADLAERAGGWQAVPVALYRTSAAARRQAKTDPFALQAWCLQLLATARSRELPARYRKTSVTREFGRRIAQLSADPSGPQLAQEALAKAGIHLVCLPHLPKTHLDGAAMLLTDGTPVIGITLRHDRIDNFWFCLCHELAHVALHLGKGNSDGFFDDLSLPTDKRLGADDVEAEADGWAEEVLIPSALWKASGVTDRPSTSEVEKLAADAGVHPAIVAGRVRHVHNNFHLLSRFVGQGEVRQCFATRKSTC